MLIDVGSRAISKAATNALGFLSVAFSFLARGIDAAPIYLDRTAVAGTG